ncbi:unnamed protein product [Peniophora sp. CBMAI 1063]|nr:unnamed protein product [Peniophora sp. CBMAI 1063]
MNLIGLDEVTIFSAQHDIYPLIDPKSSFESQAYKDKVVVITGGSTGIGATTALFYAKAGAKVIINARRVENLETHKATIEKEAPGAQVLLVGGDVSDPEVGKRIVETAIETWKRLDIVVANSATAAGPVNKLADKDALAWWHTQEVNVRGTLNIILPAIPELLKTKGQIVVTTSAMAHLRLPLTSDYNISKHTLNRFTEILALDYPEIPIYTVHPGSILTPGSDEFQEKIGTKGLFPQPVE